MKINEWYTWELVGSPFKIDRIENDKIYYTYKVGYGPFAKSYTEFMISLENGIIIKLSPVRILLEDLDD